MKKRGSLLRGMQLATDASVILVSVVFAFVIIRIYLNRPSLPEAIQAGETLADVGPLQFSQDQRTLLLVLSARCKFCEASTPFYKSLGELHSAARLRARVVAAFPDDADTAKRFMQSNGLSMPFYSMIPTATFRVYGTPTVLLVDQRGTVLHVWTGRLTTKEELALLDTLNDGS